MYLHVDKVAERYGVDAATIWRWSKDPANPFPMPHYFGATRHGDAAGFGELRRGNTARWSTRDLVFYETDQGFIADAEELDETKRAIRLAALRRRYPELRHAPGALELAAAQAHKVAHRAVVMELAALGLPLVMAQGMANGKMGFAE